MSEAYVGFYRAGILGPDEVKLEPLPSRSVVKRLEPGFVVCWILKTEDLDGGRVKNFEQGGVGQPVGDEVATIADAWHEFAPRIQAVRYCRDVQDSQVAMWYGKAK